MLKFVLVITLMLTACAPPPAQQARPHGSALTLFDCPEVDPAQPRCKVQP